MVDSYSVTWVGVSHDAAISILNVVTMAVEEGRIEGMDLSVVSTSKQMSYLMPEGVVTQGTALGY